MTMKNLAEIMIAGKLRLPLASAMAAVIVFTTVTAWACPSGYVSCGERNQLCCPKK
jgi:hypothetical protein